MVRPQVKNLISNTTLEKIVRDADNKVLEDNAKTAQILFDLEKEKIDTLKEKEEKEKKLEEARRESESIKTENEGLKAQIEESKSKQEE